MFKPLLPGTVGRLTTNVLNYSTVFTVDSALYALLAGLTPGDWTYLYVRNGALLEVIKVVSVLAPNAISVERAQEGTKRLGMPAGSTLFYGPTLDGLRDTIKEQIAPITLTATGVVSVKNNSVHAEPVIIKGMGDVDVLRHAEFWDSNLTKCGPFQCPNYVIGPPIYTSHPYPIEVIEGIVGSLAKFTRGLHSIKGDDEAVKGSIVNFIDGTLRAILQQYREWLNFNQDQESIEGSIVSFVDGTIRQILKSYSEWLNFNNLDESIEGSLVVFVDGTIKVILIDYQHWMDTTNGQSKENIKGSIVSFVSGTLT